jgi:hypothetical protein
MKQTKLTKSIEVAPFLAVLVADGWIQDYVDLDVMQLQKVSEGGNRKLQLQLWYDGNHRITHWHSGQSRLGYVSDKFGLMNTTPIEFTTIDGMHAAIKTESTKDYGY